MSSKIVIEVFGIRDQSAGGGGCGGGCSCSGGCGPAPTMGEMYQDLVEFMEKSEVKDEVTLQFVDVLADNLDEHVAVKKALDTGIGLPLTAINGEPRFYGGLSTWQVFSEIKEILQK